MNLDKHCGSSKDDPHLPSNEENSVNDITTISFCEPGGHDKRESLRVNCLNVLTDIVYRQW